MAHLVLLILLVLLARWMILILRRGAKRSLREALHEEADNEARKAWLEGARQREATRLAALRAEDDPSRTEPSSSPTSDPAPTTPPARAEPAPHVLVERERIIEREVLVMRCRYCAKLMPVDLSACRECGAKL